MLNKSTANQKFDEYCRDKGTQAGLRLEEALTLDLELKEFFVQILEKLFEHTHESLTSGKEILTCEFSILVSKILTKEPCFVIETYGCDWYHEHIAEVRFTILSFENVFFDLSEDYRLEAKRYMGALEPIMANRQMIVWLMFYLNRLVPYYQESIKTFMRSERYKTIPKMNDFEFTFGLYRGLNKTVMNK